MCVTHLISVTTGASETEAAGVEGTLITRAFQEDTPLITAPNKTVVSLIHWWLLFGMLQLNES
jgi:hypothetical protein